MPTKYVNPRDPLYKEVKFLVDHNVTAELQDLMHDFMLKLDEVDLSWSGTARRAFLGRRNVSEKFQRALKDYLSVIILDEVFTLGSGALNKGAFSEVACRVIRHNLKKGGFDEILKQELQAFGISDTRKIKGLTDYMYKGFAILLNRLTFKVSKQWVNQARHIAKNEAKVALQHAAAVDLFTKTVLPRRPG